MKQMKDLSVVKRAQKVHHKADEGPFHGAGGSKSPS